MHICLRFVVLFHYIAAAIFAATKIAASGSQSKQTHEMHCGLQNWFTPLISINLDHASQFSEMNITGTLPPLLLMAKS